MVDTVRTRADMLATLLADNVAGDITPQDMRDILVSLHGVYAQIYGTTLAAHATLTTTWEQLTGFDSNGEDVDATADQANNKITTSSSAGVYLVVGVLTFDVNASAIDVEMKIAVGGTRKDATLGRVTADGSAQEGQLTSFGILTVAGSVDITMDVRLASGTQSFNERNISLTVVRIA